MFPPSFFLRFAACLHRARGAYVGQRAQFRASRPGEGPGRARIHSAPGGYGRSRRSRAKTGGDGEEVRRPIQNGLRDNPPAHDPARIAEEKDWVYGQGKPGCLWGEKKPEGGESPISTRARSQVPQVTRARVVLLFGQGKKSGAALLKQVGMISGAISLLVSRERGSLEAGYP